MINPTPTPHAAGEAEAEQFEQRWVTAKQEYDAWKERKARTYSDGERMAFIAAHMIAAAQSHARVTRAIAAERERCAKIAAGWWALKGGEDNLFMVNAEPIAAEIRALSVPALVAAALQSQAKGENA